MPHTDQPAQLRARFGHRVRELRVERDWTQEQLSEASGIHPTYISGVERGQRNVSLDAIEKFARGFGIPTRDLF